MYIIINIASNTADIVVRIVIELINASILSPVHSPFIYFFPDSFQISSIIFISCSSSGAIKYAAP
jgi:hypothetical protein